MTWMRAKSSFRRFQRKARVCLVNNDTALLWVEEGRQTIWQRARPSGCASELAARQPGKQCQLFPPSLSASLLTETRHDRKGALAIPFMTSCTLHRKRLRPGSHDSFRNSNPPNKPWPGGIFFPSPVFTWNVQYRPNYTAISRSGRPCSSLSIGICSSDGHSKTFLSF